MDIDSGSYQRLINAKGRVDDLVINGVFALLAMLCPRDDQLVFTTYHLRSIQDGANDAVLRRKFSHTLAQVCTYIYLLTVSSGLQQLTTYRLGERTSLLSEDNGLFPYTDSSSSTGQWQSLTLVAESLRFLIALPILVRSRWIYGYVLIYSVGLVRNLTTQLLRTKDTIELVEAVLRVCESQPQYRIDWRDWQACSPLVRQLQGPVRDMRLCFP